MSSGIGTCKPAASILGVSKVDCDECPFPFCVLSEISLKLKDHMAKIIRELGSSMEETAKALNVTIRSAYRYTSTHAYTDCAQCDLTHSQDVMCRSNIYTVVRRGEQLITVLNKHRRATVREVKAVDCFIEYVFPVSIVERSMNGHDYWLLSHVEPEEIKRFEGMCTVLDKYIMTKIGIGAECLQQIR